MLPTVQMALQAKRPDRDRVDATPKKPSNPSDPVILAGLEQHEPWAAEALYDSIASTVERALERVLQRRSGDFDDLARKAFERVVRAIADRNFWIECSLTAWALVAAVGVGLEALRARDRELYVVNWGAPTEGAHDSFPPSAVTELLEARAETITMQRVLAKMKAELAEVVFLHDRMACSVADLACVMGIAPDVVETRLARARRDLLRRLETLKHLHSVS